MTCLLSRPKDVIFIFLSHCTRNLFFPPPPPFLSLSFLAKNTQEFLSPPSLYSQSCPPKDEKIPPRARPLDRPRWPIIIIIIINTKSNSSSSSSKQRPAQRRWAGTSRRNGGTGIRSASTWRTKTLRSHSRSATATTCSTSYATWTSSVRLRFTCTGVSSSDNPTRLLRALVLSGRLGEASMLWSDAFEPPTRSTGARLRPTLLGMEQSGSTYVKWKSAKLRLGGFHTRRRRRKGVISSRPSERRLRLRFWSSLLNGYYWSSST